MKKSFILCCVALMLLFYGCATITGTPKDRIISHDWNGIKAYQDQEFRIYLFDLKDSNDTCSVDKIIHFLCARGELSGSQFWNDTVKRSSTYSTTFKDTLTQDIEAFDGRHIIVERMWIKSLCRGDAADTLDIGLSVDLTGRLPGPMRIYTAHIITGPKSNPCAGTERNAILRDLTFDGWVL